jgi:hypothetical protein
MGHANALPETIVQSVVEIKDDAAYERPLLRVASAQRFLFLLLPRLCHALCRGKQLL